MQAAKASINAKTKAMKQARNKSTRSHDEYIEYATKASAMLDGLKLWHDVVEDEEFVKALGELKDESSEATQQSCGMLRGILDKDFKEAAKCFERLVASNVPKLQLQNEDPFTKKFMQKSLQTQWRSNNWDKFASSVSCIVSIIIRNLQENNLDKIESITTEDSEQRSQYEYPLYDWIERLNKTYLHVHTLPELESFRKIKCYYDINS